MRAAWYDRTGPSSVLRMGELPDPVPGPGEVRVRVTRSGVGRGDVAKRLDQQGAGMPFPRVVPGSDGAGRIDRVGEGVDAGRIGEPVWVYGAQTGRPFGTAAEWTVVPAEQAVPRGQVGADVGACLGVPGITAWEAVTGDGPVRGRTVLVHGVRGAVARMAARIAAHEGATVIGTVREGAADLPGVRVVRLDHDAEARIRELAPDGVDRIVEVDLASGARLDAEVLAPGGAIASYSSSESAPSVPYWPLSLENARIRFLGSSAFPAATARRAAEAVSRLAALDVFTFPGLQVLDLREVAAAQDLVGRGGGGRVLLGVADDGSG